MRVDSSWRHGVLALVVLAHAVLLWKALVLAPAPPPPAESALRVEFIERPREIPATPPAHDAPATAELKPEPATTQASTVSMAAPASTGPAQPLQLFDEQGRIRLPEGLMKELDRPFSADRKFDFQVPGLDDAKAMFDRPSSMPYENNRFAEYWKPDQDLLNDLLTRAVEATTKEVRIPVPGNPRETLVCKVSILAMGGGCGIEVNGAGYTGPHDDPDTLSPEEDRQCQAWWQRIIDAKSQEAWRATRALYERECRKPLERKPSG